MAILFYTFSSLCFLVSLWQMRSIKKTHNRLMFFILLCTSIALLVYQLLVDGLFLRLPHLFLVINVFALMAIVALYFYARWLVDVEFVLSKKHVFAACGIAAIYAAILIPFWSLRASEKVLIIGEIVRLNVLYTARDPELFGYSVFKISNGYFALVGLHTFLISFKIVFRKRGELANRPLFFAAICYGMCLLAAIVGTIAIVSNSLILIVISGLALSSAFGGLYIIGEKLESG